MAITREFNRYFCVVVVSVICLLLPQHILVEELDAIVVKCVPLTIHSTRLFYRSFARSRCFKRWNIFAIFSLFSCVALYFSQYCNGDIFYTQSKQTSEVDKKKIKREEKNFRPNDNCTHPAVLYVSTSSERNGSNSSTMAIR